MSDKALVENYRRWERALQIELERLRKDKPFTWGVLTGWGGKWEDELVQALRNLMDTDLAPIYRIVNILEAIEREAGIQHVRRKRLVGGAPGEFKPKKEGEPGLIRAKARIEDSK